MCFFGGPAIAMAGLLDIANDWNRRDSAARCSSCPGRQSPRAPTLDQSGLFLLAKAHAVRCLESKPSENLPRSVAVHKIQTLPSALRLKIGAVGFGTNLRTPGIPQFPWHGVCVLSCGATDDRLSWLDARPLSRWTFHHAHADGSGCNGEEFRNIVWAYLDRKGALVMSKQDATWIAEWNPEDERFWKRQARASPGAT